MILPDLSVQLQKIHGTNNKIELVIQTQFCSYSIDIQDTERLCFLLPKLQAEIQMILKAYHLQLVTKNFIIDDDKFCFDFRTMEAGL